MTPDEDHEPPDPDIVPGDRVVAVRPLRHVRPGAGGWVFSVDPPSGRGRILNIAVHWDNGCRMGLQWWANPVGEGWEGTLRVTARAAGQRRFKRPRGV